MTPSSHTSHLPAALYVLPRLLDLRGCGAAMSAYLHLRIGALRGPLRASVCRAQSTKASRRIDWLGAGGVSPLAVAPKRPTAVPPPPTRPGAAEYFAQARLAPIILAGVAVSAGLGLVYWALPRDYFSALSEILLSTKEASSSPPPPPPALALPPPVETAAAAVVPPLPAHSPSPQPPMAEAASPAAAAAPRTWMQWAGLAA